MIRKKLIAFSALLTLLVCGNSSAFSQIDSIKMAKKYMTELYSELQQISAKLEEFDDIALIEKDLATSNFYMEDYFNENKKMIVDNRKQLFDIYSDYEILNTEIKKKIAELEAEEGVQKNKEKLLVNFDKYDAHFKQLYESATNYVANKDHDSLEMAQTKANTTYNDISNEYLANKALFDGDELLNKKYEEIKNTYEQIITLKSKRINVMDIVFKVTITLAAFFMIYNIVRAKLKIKPKKKDEEPTPTL